MKNVLHVKINTFILIFLLINLILQPVCIYFYIINKTDTLSIVQHSLAGIYLTFSVSILINEAIYKVIFYKMLKGKIISNGSNGKLLYPIYILMLFILFSYWLLFFMFESHDFSYPMSLIILISVIDLKNTYIISNGYLFCGFKVIPLDTVSWYKIYKSRNSHKLFMKYQGNRYFSTSNSPKCIEELSSYFDTHSIIRKYNDKAS